MYHWSPAMGLGAIFLDSLNLEIFLDGCLKRQDGEVVNSLSRRFEERFGPAAVISERSDFLFLRELLGEEKFFAYLRAKTRMPDAYYDFLSVQLGLPKEGGVCSKRICPRVKTAR